MPIMNGFEATHAIRASDKTYRNIPIIAVTANASLKDHNHCLEAGMNDFMPKPIILNQLKTMLNKFLGDFEPNDLRVTSNDVATAMSANEGAANESGLERVLIVEDNISNQMIVKAIVKKIGLETVLAENGCEALERLQQSPIDFILMDCQMPVMDGFEATRRIRALEGPQGQIPIIAITANSSDKDKQKCLDCGMDDFLSKPISFQIIDSTLKQWRDKKPRMVS